MAKVIFYQIASHKMFSLHESEKFYKPVAFVFQDIVAATAALEEVKQSGKFHRILELVLLMGNYMNSGSRNAQSLGFEINFLTKVCAAPACWAH